MEMKRRLPLGVELVKRGIVTERDIEQALEYQRNYPNMKLGKYTAGDMVALFKNTVNYFRKEMNLHNGK